MARSRAKRPRTIWPSNYESKFAEINHECTLFVHYTGRHLCFARWPLINWTITVLARYRELQMHYCISSIVSFVFKKSITHEGSSKKQQQQQICLEIGVFFHLRDEREHILPSPIRRSGSFCSYMIWSSFPCEDDMHACFFWHCMEFILSQIPIFLARSGNKQPLFLLYFFLGFFVWGW